MILIEHLCKKIIFGNVGKYKCFLRNFVRSATFLATFLWLKREDIKCLFQQPKNYFSLNVNFLFIILLPSKWYTFSKLAMVLFQLHCMQFFQFEIILCVASCVIWFRCVSSCSCGERREFLSIPKVVFHQKVTCGGLSTVSPLFSCLLFLVHPAPNVQGISNSTDRSSNAYMDGRAVKISPNS